jgi:hypothetical protein
VEKKHDDDAVQSFKLFIQKHPGCIKDVRRGVMSWQECYEDWYLLGEDHDKWKPYKSERIDHVDKEKGDESAVSTKWVNQLTESVKKMNANDIQKHLSSATQAVSALQGLLSQFQTSGENSEVKGKPFSFPTFKNRKD